MDDNIYPGLEHSILKGYTIKNMMVTIISTASIVATVMGSYFNLKSTMSLDRADQNTHNQITELRLKVLEDKQIIIQHEIDEIKEEEEADK